MEVVVLDVWLEEMERTRLKNKRCVTDVELSDVCSRCLSVTLDIVKQTH